jgi:hypothetical protein
MWASDYPRTNRTFPKSQRAVEEDLGSLPPEDRRKITALNCAQLSNLSMLPERADPAQAGTTRFRRVAASSVGCMSLEEENAS